MNKNHVYGLIFLLVLSFSTITMLCSYQTVNSLSQIDNNDVLPTQNLLYDNNLLKMVSNPQVKEIKVIITFKEGISSELGYELLNINAVNSLRLTHEYTYINAVAAIINKEHLAELENYNFIKKIYLDKRYQFEKPEVLLQSIPTTALYENSREAIASEYLTDSLGYNGENIKIAILDSGIKSSHPDLSGKVIAQSSFVDGEDADDLNGHGTHIAGIIAGSGTASNGLYRGIAPAAKLINAKCASVAGVAYTSDIISALEWSVDVQHANIVSISLGGGAGDPNDPLSLAVDKAVDKGVIVVIASGNSGPEFASVGVPAAAEKVISVGASDLDDKLASFSSRGPTIDGRVSPDVIAPGVDIVSTLAADSVFDIVSQDFLSPDPRILGTGQYANDYYYISLSGTSMATPHVTAAVALLLSAFPNLKNNPHAIKSALMNTAVKLSGSSGEYSPNLQGSGRINVSAAYNYLLNLNSSSNYIPTTTILPDAFPIEPYRVMYPGQDLSVKIKFITGEPLNLTIRNTASNASSFIWVGNDTYTTGSEWNISVNDYLDIGLRLIIPFNCSKGYYSGNIELLNASGQSLHNITVSFSISIPRARIYFDMLHNSDIEDSPFINYYSFINTLMDSNYAVYYGENLLTYEFVSNFDLIILPDIEGQLFNFEINALQKYFSEGGNLLVLGSYYPMFASESLNKLLSNYGISFNDGYSGNIYSFEDIGLDRIFQTIIVTDIVHPHAITNGVSSYTFNVGLNLIVNSPSQVLARYSSKPVLAVYDNSLNDGRLAVFSSELTFYSNNFEGDNRQLAVNTINWLLSERNTLISVAADNQMVELNGSHTEYVTLFASDGGGALEGLTSGVDLFFTLNNSVSLPVTELGDGVYQSNFTVNSVGKYTVNVTVVNSGETVTRFTQTVVVYNIPRITSFNQQKQGSLAPGFSYPLWTSSADLNESLIISKFGEYVNITASTSNANAVLFASNSDFQNFYDVTTRDITYIYDNMSSLSGSLWNYTVMPIPSTFNSSSYPYYLIPYNTSQDTFNPTGFVKGFFVVVGSDPEINDEKSMIGGTLIDDLQKAQTVSGQLIPVYNLVLGTNVTFSTTGTDYEDAASNLRGYVWFLNVPLYYFTGNPILAVKMTYVPSTGNFVSSWRVANTIITGPAGTVMLSGNVVYSFIFFLLDSEGNVAQGQQVAVLYQSQFGFLSSPFIIAIILFTLFIVIMFLYQRRVARIRKQQQQAAPPYPVEIPSEIQLDDYLFCPYCGSKIHRGDIYCLSCGEKLPDEGNAKDILGDENIDNSLTDDESSEHADDDYSDI
ncbi:MAG: S8 family serine peptidase [Candidatus Odinarchaeia archaeon]